MSYYFICLFRADKSTSGLALRIPALWKVLAEQGEDVYLIINHSLYDKTLKGIDKSVLNKVHIIPENLGFKASCLAYVPPLLTYLALIKDIKFFHLSVGGAYFIDYLKIISKVFSKDITIHTSIGSKNLDMIVDGNRESRYYKLHINLMKKSDKIDCLYSPEGFPQFKDKCIQSPGSFSWKFDTKYINNIAMDTKKNNDIVFCGSLLPQKNYRLAIDSYKKLSGNLLSENKFNLILVAPNIPKELLLEIDSFNTNNVGKIIIEDYKNIDRVLKNSYIFLSLQDYDNYPSQSLIEAMIFGCTIIATDTGETSKLVKENFNNILIKKDINELIEAMITLINKPNSINVKNINLIKREHTVELYADYFRYNFLN